MSPADLVLTAGAALVIGALIGAVGIGGVLLTPWLTHVIGLPVRDAIVICSFAFIGTGLAALAISARALRDRPAFDWPLLLATIPGALIGAFTLVILPPRVALAVLAAMSVIVGLKSLSGSRQVITVASPSRLAPGTAVGAFTGFASALTGTGGPMVLVPMLVWARMPIREAILLGQVVQLPIALAASAGNLYFGDIDIAAGAAIGLLLVPGAVAGHRVAGLLPAVALTRLVGIALLAAGAAFAFKAAG